MQLRDLVTGSLWSSQYQGCCSYPTTAQRKLKMENLSGESDPVEVQKYQLDGVKGTVCTQTGHNSTLSKL